MLHIYSDPAALSQAAADFFAATAQQAVQSNGRFTVALTGGSSPKQLYEILAKPPYKEGLPWDKTYIFWGDERWVPFDDPQNNARMAYETLLNHVAIPESQIYPMSGVLPPASSAAQYESVLQQHFGDAAPVFDLILLGMGNDGHTASLFPHTPVLSEQSRWVKELYLSGQEMYRITLTAPLINQAAKIAFLLFGSSKAQVLYQVLKGEYNPGQYPSQLIQPKHGELHFFADREAASLLK